MPGGVQESLVRSIQALFESGATGSLTDAELLERFLDRRGEEAEAAFEALVVRHGPVVLSVCRSVLGAGHDDVEDAFQATFLILACKAGAIRRRESLASWLFGVARRVAIRARADAVRRRVHERRAAEMKRAEVEPAEERRIEFSAILEEIDKLPLKYREPVLLCDMQGLTYERAAERLNCPLGTLSIRLKRARERLRTRLTRQELGDGGGWFVAGLAPRAPVPQALVASTVRTAICGTMGKTIGAGVASATVITLTGGALRSMFIYRLKLVVVGLGSLALGAGIWAWRAPAAADEPTTPRPRQALNVPELSKEAKKKEPVKFQMAGTVRDEATSRPVAGAKINVMTGDSGKRHRGTNQDALSGENGEFHLDLPPGNARAWTLIAPVGYWAIENSKNIESFTLTKAGPVFRKDYLVRRGTVWDFRITREANVEPLRGEIIAFEQPNSFRSAVGDAGLVHLTLPTEQGKVTASAAVKLEQLTAPDTAQLVLEWESGFRPDAVGSVSSVAGSPIRYRLTDDQGKTATITAPEQGRGQVEPKIESGRLVVEVTLPVLDPKLFGELTGKVVAESGTPIAGAQVALIWVGENGASGMSSDDRHTVLTDTRGRYQFGPIPRTPKPESPVLLQLAVTKEGFAGIDTQQFRFQPPEGNSPQVVEPVTLKPGVSITGTVVDPDGTPLAGAWVEPGGSYASRSQFTKTDDNGRFTVRDLPVGMVPFHFSYGKLFAQGKYVVDNTPDSLTIKLRPVPDPDKRKAQADAAKATRPKPIAVGAVAPEWEVGDWSDGRARKLADYRGKVVFLDFWGIWCGPCVHALPAIEKARAKYEPRGVVFVSIHTPGETEKAVRKLLELKKVSLDFAFDRSRDGDEEIWNGVTAERYGVGGYPTSLIIDREGKIAFSSSDPGNMPAMMAIVREMGIDPKKFTEEQATQMIEQFLDQAIDRVLNPPTQH